MSETTGNAELIKRLFKLHNRMACMDGINNDDLGTILDAYDALEAAERVNAAAQTVEFAFDAYVGNEGHTGHMAKWKELRHAIVDLRNARTQLARHATGRKGGDDE